MSKTTPRRPTRRSPILPTILIAVLLLIGYSTFVTLWTDKLWFDSVSFASVFSTRLWTQAALFTVFGLIMAGAVALTVWLAYRLRPRTRRTGASAVLDRYRDLLEARLGLMMAVPAAFLGILAGSSAVSRTLTYLAWVNSTRFGIADSRFGMDVSFYVFDYPWWRYVASFALTTLVLCTIIAIIVHFAMGGLGSVRSAQLRGKMAGSGHAHVSVLIGLTLIAYGLDNLLDQYGFLLSDSGLFTGLHYTDDHARITARIVVAVIAFVCAALFFANVFLRRWLVPVAGVILMVVSSLILTLIYPAVVQSFGVKPDEPDLERPYMAAHIEATRQAYGVAQTEVENYSAKTTVSPGQLRADAAALPGIRLIDPAVVAPTFEQLQQVRGYYSFPSALDVDRYTINGVETDAVVAARELDMTGVPDPNWNNVHTVFTHGYGMVAAYGNRRQPAGEPEWIARDIPPVGALAEHEPRIYFGERTTQYAVVGRAPGEQPIELDTPGGGENGGERNNVYTGTGGVPVGNVFDRALYATKFMDINLMLSDRVNENSKILYDRTPKERVEAVAPWLTVDSDVYPAVVDGRVVWIVDGYTTSSTYPNSQQISLRDATSDTRSQQVGPQIDETLNYIRNSVKAVVDAYDGTVALYAWDENDPVLKTWQRVFPDSVRPKSAISADLRAHLRYPQDLFKVQREILGRYHMTNPDTWYKQSDLWTVPTDPVKGQTELKEPPYYLSIKWPGDARPVFSQTTVFVPKGRSNLASYLAVNADASSPDYGKLRVLRMSDTQQIDGPGQTFNTMTTNEKVAERLRPFLNQGASSATYGNLLTLPLGGGLLYVEPIYTQRQGNSGAYPALRFVVVRFGEHVGIGDTLQEALDQIFKGNSGANTGEDDPNNKPTGKVDQAAAIAALEKAKAAYQAADAALKAGDLATYQKKNDEAKAALAEALKAMGR